MNTLLKKLKNYSVEDCYAIEEDSKEFAILFDIFKKINNKEFFLPLIVSNSIVSYNLSKQGDKYWEKILVEIEGFQFNNIDDIYLFFIDFLPKIVSNNNNIRKKITKLKKLRVFLDDLYFKQTYYYKNMLLLSQKIAQHSGTLFDDLIVTHTIKMYSYSSRIRFNKHVPFPQEFLFVMNEKLETLCERYDGTFEGDIKKFYLELSKQLGISPMHLKTLLLNEYDSLMKMSISKQ